ncbi:hypothetical protein MYCTH_2090897 [Thermothelomyces thermophilus ATCC 42464]|uniref:Phospholipid/glycerol acyltransferase domain-containing protein n=1 Tax=Thermothelomyces thermophilus (strain ATCC 42464 / BCRC 31852 / DSM 1799) TaxID=573729 RepID=G2QAM4_THET4|nr:uncharacterized protein MYCTH_2090897 [Thermothelomyces thermophilus ATCC 42464]AEO56720.1 hypothetical protein MYCTH_2090897 [Thermothelomyces thermophilus ATCC 42464]
MEKFSQFRDRGSGIAPFLPVTTESSIFATLFHAVLFLFRLPLFLAFSTAYFLVLQHIPFLPAVIRKLLLWSLLAIPGVWWVDLQLDGVKRGSLSQQPRSRVPGARSIIAANFTSPIDALYLAAVFDPVFVAAHPSSRKVRPIGLFSAILAALSPSAQLSTLAQWEADGGDGLTDLRALVARYPGRAIAVFPECGTTNGRGILPLSPCLLTAPAESPIFAVSLRYTPPDVTTPILGAKGSAAFAWKLLGRPTHYIRVRIAEGVHNTTAASNGVSAGSAAAGSVRRGDWEGRAEDQPTAEEQQLLDRIGEALARLGRAKRVGLTLKEKAAFLKAWAKR